MTVPLAGSIGAELALQIKQGADFILDIELTDSAGAPWNTAPYTAVANLRKKAFALPVTAFVCTFPVVGTLRITLARTVTAAISCGSDFDDEASGYVWDLELIKTSDQTVTPAFFGDVQVLRNI